MSSVRVASASIAPSFDYPSFVETMHRRFAELRSQAGALHREFAAAQPFPHVVIDDFLPGEVAEEAHRAFPQGDSSVWTRLLSDDQRAKLVTLDEGTIPPSLRAIIHELNAGAFLSVLQEVTGIPELIADTKLEGGGLHRIERGGRLSVHIDFSHHPQTRLNRRLNLLIYLNKEWPEGFGGHFELWDPNVTACRERLLPIFNRCVIFATSPISFHGHPEPLACPDDRARKSIALYYFSNGRDNEVDVRHNTTFRSTEGNRAGLSAHLARSVRAGVVHDLIPPLAYRLAKRLLTGRTR